MVSHAVEPVPPPNDATYLSTVMVQNHQPGEAVCKSILPEDVDWKSFPAFPPAARLAVLVGEPYSSRALFDQGQGALWREAYAA
jgi:hypothetical protein